MAASEVIPLPLFVAVCGVVYAASLLCLSVLSLVQGKFWSAPEWSFQVLDNHGVPSLPIRHTVLHGGVATRAISRATGAALCRSRACEKHWLLFQHSS